MSPETSIEILAELRIIKWLLMALVLVGVFFVYFVFHAIAQISKDASQVNENLEYQKFQKEMEGLLLRGSYEIAISFAKRRLEVYPTDVYAHYFLAQALYHTDKLHDARRAFERVAELAPTWQRAADAWIDRVEDKLRDAGPKVIK